MGAAGAPVNARAARDFAMEYRNLMAAGLKEGSARRLSLQAQQAVSVPDFERLCADMREVYRREVSEGDPVEVQKRLKKEGAAFLDEVEVQMYARSGVRDYVLKRAGILAEEKTAAGLNRISLPNKETPDKPTVLEWSDEQLNAWVEMQHESTVVETMRELQARVAGAALGDAAVEDADIKGMLVNMRELPVRALARMERTGGRVTYDVLKDLAADAREQVDGFVEGGMSEREAFRQMSEIPGVRLGTLVNAAEGFTQRVEAIVGTPEGDALGIMRPEDASTAVFRLNGVAPGQSVLLFNKGLATEREMVEDLIERDVIAATSGEGAVTTLAALEKMLRRVQAHLVRYEGGMRLLPKDKAASEMDVVEAFSKLAQSRFLLHHEQYSMPQEAHDSIEYVQKKLAHTQHLVALSRAWDAFAGSEEGRAFIEKEGATLEKLMSDAGASVAGQYSRARFDADAFEAVRLAYEQSVASPEAAQETLLEYEAEQQELDHPQEQEGSIPASASITGEALPLFDSEPVNQDTGEQLLQPGEVEQSGGNPGRSLVGERYVEVGDGSVLGVAEVEGVSLSADVPQFKKKESAAGRVEADADGTTHELAGGWNANSAPIHVWRRSDGRLEVISGRHRLAHARKNGVKFIQVRVYDEGAACDAQWAKLHDVEQNILDNTCNAIDVAYYFRHNPLTMAEAEARGLLPKTRAGEQTAASRIGLTVAANASDNTFALLVNGKCTAEDAYMAVLIAATEEGQLLALDARAGKNGKKNSWEYVTALVRGAEQMQPADGGMLDLFGNDESFREGSEKLARYVAAVREGLKARISIFVNSSKLNRKADVAKELGVKLSTPEDATRLIERLANLDAAYERLDPDLGIPAKAEAWDGKSAVPTKLDELAAGSSYSLSGGMTAYKSEHFVPDESRVRAYVEPYHGRGDVWSGYDPAPYFEYGGHRVPLFGRGGIFSAALDMGSFIEEKAELIKGKWEEWKKNVLEVLRDKEKENVFENMRKSLADGNVNATLKKRIEQGVVNAPEYYTSAARGKAIEEVRNEATNARKQTEKAEFAYRQMKLDVVASCIEKAGLWWNFARSRKSKSCYFYISKRTEDKVMVDGWVVRISDHDYPGPGHESHLELRFWDSNAMIAEKIAKFAERVEADDYEFDKKQRGIFSWSLTPARAHIDAQNGNFSASITGGRMMSDEMKRIKDAAEKNGTFMKAPNGKPSKLTEHQWLQVRTGAFKGWFGDWERAAELTFDGSEYNNETCLKMLTAEAGTPFVNEETGIEAEINNRQRGKITSGKAQRKSKESGFSTGVHNFVAAHIRRLFKHAVHVGDYRDKNQSDDVLTIKRFVCPVRVKEAEAFAYMTVKELKQHGHKIYTLELDTIERLGGNLDEHFEEMLNPAPSKGIVARLNELNKTYFENSSKVVDENGEPLVVYRGARVDEGNVLGVSLSPKQQRELHVNDYTNNYYPGAIWLSDSAFTAQTYMQQYALDDRAEAKEARVDAAYENGGELYTVDDTEFLFSGQYVSKSGKVMYKREALVTSRLAKSLFAEGNGLEGHFYLRRKGEGISVDTKSWVIANKRIPYPTSHQDAVNKANEELHSIDAIEVAANSRLYACFVNAKNPYYYDFKGEQFSEMGRKLKDALNDGYDALLALNVKDPGSYENRKRVRPAMTIGVISSAQIKSATDNRGTFDGSSPDITYSVIGRNVQERRDWTMDRREAIPFNDTLEYPGEALVTYSLTGAAQVESDWQNALDKFVQNPPAAGSVEYRSDMYVCPTPAVMQMVGARVYDIVLSPDVLVKCLDENIVSGVGKTLKQLYPKEKRRHAITLGTMGQLPASLAEPVCIMVSDTPGCVEVVTELKEGSDNILVAVQLNALREGSRVLKVNRIVSLYGKEHITNLLNHPCLYWDKAKARIWTGGGGLQSSTAPYPKRASGRKILKPADLVKYKLTTGLTFSLRGRGLIDSVDLGVMAREEQMQRLVSYARREAARWERTFAKDTSNAKAAEAMGTISSIQTAILRVLPPKYRPALAAQMRYVEVYARMLESGRVSAKGNLKPEELAALKEELGEVLADDLALVSGGIWYDEKPDEKLPRYEELKRKADALKEAKKMLTSELGAKKLAQAAARMLNDAADAVERWMIAVELERVERMKERLAPRKLPNGKYDKGKMSAEAYKEFVRYCELMELDADTVAEQLHELEALIAAEEGKDEPDAVKVDKLAAKMAELAAYGNLKGKSLEAVRKGVAALTAFVQNERNVWQGKLEHERERAKRAARVMSELMGAGDEVKLAVNAAKEEETLRMFSSMGAGFKSLSQMFYGMGGIPGLRELMDESLEALAHGHVQLGLRERRAYDRLGEFMKEQLGLDTEVKRNDWMAGLKKKVDTGVKRAGELVVHKLELTKEEAAGWLELDKEEREVRRRELLDAAEESGVDAQNVVYEEDIPLLRDELAKFNDLPGMRKFVRTERSWRKAQPGNIVASRDEILNILLLCEQTEYQQAADENGYTAEVLAKLRAAVGEDVMAFGHEMRKVLEGSGLAAVYEAREGIPFPAVQNYWPGRFDLSAKMNEQANALDPTTGTGTRYGMLITRVKHKLKFNLNLGASNVFLAALAQQNNYICMGELTARWRRLLSHSNFAMSLKQRLGDKQFKQLKELINLLDGAGIAESVTQQNLSSLVGRFQSAHAMAALAGSPITLIKQTSAMLHAGAWEGIKPLRVLWHLLKDRAGKGAITYGEVAQMDCFKVRYRDNRYFTEMMQLGRDANWSKLATWARTGMDWIEKMDVVCNAASMTALYNIKYEQLHAANEGAADPMSEEEIRGICAKTVEQALELVAQPLRRTQKSAAAALSRNAMVKSACYMSSESLNKIGMYAAIKQRNGGGIKGRVAALKFLLPMSIAQQATVMALDMLRGTAPDADDDEWAEWFWLNVATGCTGLGMLQSVPMLGEFVGWATGGYVKTASLGEMLFDFRGAVRSGKRLWRMGADDKDYSGWEWAWQLMNFGRFMTAGTAVGRGINSTSKVFSEVSGGLQSLNAVLNHVRPFIQGVRNREED